MSMRKFVIALLALSMLSGVFGLAAAQDETTEEVVITRSSAPDAANVTLTTIASGLRNPLGVVSAHDGSNRLFVMEQAGRILIMQDGEMMPTPFADLSGIVSQDILRGYSERGLLGLAFHPNFEENQRLFVNYTDRNGTTHLAEFTVMADDPNQIDVNSEQTLLTLEQPYPNHNGGHIEFGPDGFLYVSIGDGGAANDPLETGQDPTDLYGSIIRIDVDAESGYAIPEDNPVATDPDFAPEVWSYGLRNVWRFSFDRATGDMYLADVGQNQFEEVNFEPADTEGGLNYGWDDFEASNPFEAGTAPENMVYPFAQYAHNEGCSVTGGYVYRGAAIPDLEGVYLFSDYCSGRVWASYRDEAGEWQTNVFLNTQRQVSSFGEDESGELYLVDYRGQVLRFDPAQ